MLSDMAIQLLHPSLDYAPFITTKVVLIVMVLIVMVSLVLLNMDGMYRCNRWSDFCSDARGGCVCASLY